MTTLVALTIALAIHALTFLQLICQPHVAHSASQPASFSVTKMSFARQQQSTATDAHKSQPRLQPSETTAEIITPNKASVTRNLANEKQHTKVQYEIPPKTQQTKVIPLAVTENASVNSKQLTEHTLATETTNTETQNTGTIITPTANTPTSALSNNSAVLSTSGGKTSTEVSRQANSPNNLVIDPIERKTNQYINFIRSEILKHKHYPKQAKLRRHQGSITVAFTLTAEGDIKNIQLLQKSSSKYLNKSVRKLLRRIQLPAAEQQIRQVFPKQISLTLEFTLNTLNS
ncbi:TonB family protein [Shewanella gelidimarina]|uniref:energy transducer TonB n=1 Tax=Shewanella gelidimarina TaxID=56813 RepID=UPI00200D1B98|nr:energy transducer TonB [Shewanella gelidimarina]MCL1058078.1 TonB family protein [Shewanella gelidimarina]